MTEIIMKQKGFEIVCLDCGCRKRVLPGEVPVGDCKFCYEEFGWVLFPKWFAPPRYQYEVPLWNEYEDNIMIVVDMKEPLDSWDRIVQVRRNGMIWYDKATMWVKP